MIAVSIFKVMGPIMIGPSSSHTAGPVKIGHIASLLLDGKTKSAEILFHGSFAQTAKGHGTDRAVVAGILGYNLDDERIKEAIKIAIDEGIAIKFKTIDLKKAHPNTVILKLQNETQQVQVEGHSLGGGDILIKYINEYQVDITAKYPTFWLLHKDQSGKIALITSLISKYRLNIAFMKVFRTQKGNIASSVIEVDQKIPRAIVAELKEINGMIKVSLIPAIL